jgi:hypothetical protein
VQTTSESHSGKLERLFGSITTELLPELPGHLVHGKPASEPALTLPQLDAALGQWITTVYYQRPHSETGQPPQRAWTADGWLPRTPDTLEDLDLLLVMVATPRVVHRAGIRFQGLRYLDPTLAAYVGEPVTIRYDPRIPKFAQARSSQASTNAEPLSTLCRHRHNVDYADPWVMPTAVRTYWSAGVSARGASA